MMQDELQLDFLEPLQIWAKLQEIMLKKREILVWLDFYRDRLEREQQKLVLFKEKEKILQAAFERRASAEELSELKAWSVEF